MSFRFHFGRPQAVAALLLLFFFAEALVVIARAPITASDYRYALCGREMWEKPSPALGYFTTCGNMQGDGTFAYRLAALPLTVYIQSLRLQDYLARKADERKPLQQRTYEANPIGGSVYDLRHQLTGLKYLLRVPFALASMLLGAGLWWVCRRLFGNLGGFFALGLYVLSPAVLSAATTPNNDILAAWGMFATVYTAIGIAHAMYGPTRKWRPRIVLFTVALGLTACAHVLAAIVALFFSALFLLYVAERRRTAVLPLLIGSGFGALFIVFASYAFHLGAFFYVFTAGSARFIPSQLPAFAFVSSLVDAPTTIALAISFVLFLSVRRSRYFGNTAPFVVALFTLPLVTTQLTTDPVLWALPFLFTFIAGIFADAFETPYRKLFLAFASTVLAAQAVLTWTTLLALHR